MGIKFVEVSNASFSLKAQFAKSMERRRKILVGAMVQVNGSVKVTDRPGYVWVREYGKSQSDSGGVFQVFCPSEVSIAKNTPVFIGPSPKVPFRLQILGIDYTALPEVDNYTGQPYVIGEHRKTHTWVPGKPTGDYSTDPVDVTERNMSFGRVYPTNPVSMKCRVSSVTYEYATSEVLQRFSGTTTIDFTAQVPASANKAKLAYVCVNGATNALAYVYGSEFTWTSFADSVPSSAKGTVPAGYLLLGRIILYNGMASITESCFRYDEKVFHKTVGGGGGIINDTQDANHVCAGPTTGAAALPTFRHLVAADLGTGAPDGSKFLRDDNTWQVPPGAGGMTRLAHTTLGGDVASVTFDSIDGSYDVLVLKWTARSTTAGSAYDVLQMQFNDDGGTNYDYQLTESTDTTVSTSQNFGQTSVRAGLIAQDSCAAGLCGGGSIDVPGYAGAFHKTGLAKATAKRSTSVDGMRDCSSAWAWRNTGVITKIVLSSSGGNLKTGSTFALYGM